MVFNIELPFDRIKITAINELYSANPQKANSGTSPNSTVPRSHQTTEEEYSGTLTVTSKPISIVKIDFQVVE